MRNQHLSPEPVLLVSKLSCLSSPPSGLSLKAPNTIYYNSSSYMSVSFANSRVNPHHHLLNKHFCVSGTMLVDLHAFSLILLTALRVRCQAFHYTDEQTGSERLSVWPHAKELVSGGASFWNEV